ncbi:hypothetical protein ACP275_10G044800 [Erythranthe tilingii]
MTVIANKTQFQFMTLVSRTNYVNLPIFELIDFSVFLFFSECQRMDFDDVKKAAKDVEAKGLNPGLIVLLVIGGLVISFLVGNYALYVYAQKNLPPKKKKPISKKKMKKERLKQGVAAPGE